MAHAFIWQNCPQKTIFKYLRKAIDLIQLNITYSIFIINTTMGKHIQVLLALLAITLSYNIKSPKSPVQGVLIMSGRSGTNTPFSLQELFCFENSGYELATLRYSYDASLLKWYSATNLTDCFTAGLSTDILIYPYSDATATSQIDWLFAQVEAAKYGMVWVNVESGSFKPSCNFLVKITNAIIAKGKTVGIRTSKESWNALFGTQGCQGLTRFPLWNNATETFGGWSRNTRLSLQGNQTICSYSMSVYN